MVFKKAKDWLMDDERREQILKEVRHYLGYWGGPVFIIEAMLMASAKHAYETDEELLLLPGAVPDRSGMPLDAGAIYNVSELPAVWDMEMRASWNVDLEDIRNMSTATRRQLLDAGKDYPAPVPWQAIREPMNVLCTAETAARLLCHCIPAELRTEEAQIPPLVTAVTGKGDEMPPEQLYIQYHRYWGLAVFGAIFLLRRVVEGLLENFDEEENDHANL